MRVKIILLGTLFIFLVSISLSSAVCTLILDDTNYKQGETVTAEMSCSIGNERNQAYTINWTNQSNDQIQIDTGTTPSTAGEDFFEDLVLPLDYLTEHGNIINATMTGTNLEGEDNSSVIATTDSDLLIEEINVTSPNFIGKTLGISAKVKNATDSGVSGAICRVDIETSEGLAITRFPIISTFDGDIDAEFEITEFLFDEGTQLLADVNCFCNAGTSFQCSNAVVGSGGDAKKSFLINDLGDFMIPSYHGN